MRKVTVLTLLVTGMVGIGAGCATPAKTGSPTPEAQKPAPKPPAPAPVEAQEPAPEPTPEPATPAPTQAQKPAPQPTTPTPPGEQEPTKKLAGPPFTAENNPTTLAGRGKPDLSDVFRPAAWIYIDGRHGQFSEREGRQQLEWVIDGPVSPTPTFRVEVYEPLLANPRDFNCILKRRPNGDVDVNYAIAAKPGSFEISQVYSLVNPGDGFVIRAQPSREIVSAIDPLPPGDYVLVGGVSNKETGNRCPAVTRFTVGDSP